MSKLYLVSYDLRVPGRNYQPVWDELKRLGAVRVLASSGSCVTKPPHTT